MPDPSPTASTNSSSSVIEPLGVQGGAASEHASQAELTGRYQQVLMNTFGPPARVFVRGEGIHLWDADGNRYQDMLGGLAVTALGQANPTVMAAISSQLATLGHISNLFASPGQIRLAERLIQTVVGAEPGTARLFFTNSGSEANEAAFKVARRTGRPKIISMTGSFHGRTMGSLALTHTPKYREPFEPLPGGVEFVPYGDVEALRAAVDDQTAAVVIEPIQGENGVVVPPQGYLQAVREITAAAGALMWVDEVQTGMGRTGQWLATSVLAPGVRPDIITLAKGLGNGFPIGACIVCDVDEPVAGRPRNTELLQPGQHGTTFGGNPVAAIAGLAVIGVIERDELLANTRQRGEQLAREVEGWQHRLVDQVRGAGLLRGIVFTEPIAAQVHTSLLDEGIVANAPRPDVLRVAPALIITEDQMRTFTQTLRRVLDEMEAA